MAVTTIDDLYRDFDADGQPASGPHHPLKQDIRDTLKALLEGSSVFPDNRVIRLNNANEGDANTIKVSSSVAIPSAAYQVLYVLNVTRTNTGPVNVTGAINRTLVTNISKQVPLGYLTPGMAVLCIDTGNALRMLSYGDMETIVRDAETARDLAANYASDALAGGMDPGLSTFTAIAGLEIPSGILRFTTGGYTVVADGGGGLMKLVASGPANSFRTQSSDGQWWELSENIPTLEMFGAKGDGIVDDTAARDAAFEYVGINGRINLLDGKTYLVSNNDNAVSVGFEGKGQLVTTVTGGLRQRNTYAENTRIAIGHEYLERIYTYFDVSRIVGPFIIRIFGDSTATEGYGAHTPYEVISRNFAERGIGRYTLYNQAVAGQTWEDLDLISYLGGGTALAFLKFGINDATQGGGTIEQRLMHMRSVMDTKLSAIRSHPNGSQGAISLALIGPTTVSNSPVGCDERWMERCRDIYLEMARKHKCFYFDSYAFMLDARDGAAGLYLDDPYGDGRGIHPWGQFNNRLWGAIFEAAFPRSSTVNYASNLFTNNGSVGAPLSAGTPPEFFLEGIALDRATPANLWPIDGYVQSTKNVDGGVLQELFNYGTYPIVRRRVANQIDGVFSPWEGTPIAVSPGAGFTLSANPNQAGVARIGTFCMGCGALDFVAGTVMSAASQVCYLPQNFLPHGDYQAICLVVFNVNNSFSEVIPAQILPNGTVRTLKNTSAAITTVFLGGINYLSLM